MKNIKKKTIGVVGFGHLGSSIVESMIRGGFPKENLMISFRGNPKTLARAVDMVVEECLAETVSLMKSADIIILATRPQDLREIADNYVRKDALVISFMAALPLQILKNIFSCSVCRAMCSGPETITAGRGVSVLFPAVDEAKAIIELSGINSLEIRSEDEIDAFTAGICIPPILMNIKISESEKKKTLSEMTVRFSFYNELGKWIEDELASASSDNKHSSLENISTKGGISEAMITSLIKGTSLESSINTGIRRCSEIRSEICIKIGVNAA
ncbi:MAG: NAD(P)-binding domain-containing protein [Synergistaceae bacterium]|nr:NAD(P)-binding domain-containing protein [Synergistaceae bacterium]